MLAKIKDITVIGTLWAAWIILILATNRVNYPDWYRSSEGITK